MASKIDNVVELKNVQQEAPAVETTEMETAQVYYSRIITEDNRKAIAEKFIDFVRENNLHFEEALMGCTDYFTSVLVSMVMESATSEEELAASDERFNNLRNALSEVLNKADNVSMGDNLLALLTLVTQSVMIIAEQGKEA